MRIIKIIAGLGYLFAAFLLGLFALFSFREWGDIFVAFIPVVFTFCLFVAGGFLVAKWRSPVSKRIRVFIFLTMGVFVASCIILGAHIRHERKLLQTRAKEFLSRSVPSTLETNFIDGYQARPNETVLSGSRALIERYANNGRIRWSAAIQGQFAVQPFETASCENADVVKTNEEARLYVADCKAIIDEEWRMGFWQWVEDTIEMKQTIPEIEEEERVDRFIQQLDGTWTNNSGMMTIAPDGRFSLRWANQDHTNVYGGRQMFGARDGVLILIFTNASGTEPHWSVDEEAHFRIIHVDDHHLVYEVDNQTNSMGR